MKDIYIDWIAGRLEIKHWQVENCAEMFAEGNSIPFISRYRKEKTGGMDDASVAEVKHWVDVFSEMEKQNYPSEVTEALRDTVDCNLYFFDNKVGIPAMYAVLVTSVVLLISVYVLLNVVKSKKEM